jgi:phosphohistidine swiveling domain-containing protein
MLEKLFTSKPRVKILHWFFQHPNQWFYARQIVKATKLDPGNTQRELEKLIELNLLIVKKRGSSRFFCLNKNNPYFSGLKQLFANYQHHNLESGSKPKNNRTGTGLKYLADQDPWMLGEDIPDMDFFFSQIWLSSFANEFKKTAGVAYKKIMCIFKGYHLWFYYGQDDSNKVGNWLVKRFLSKPEFTGKINQQIVYWSDKLRSFAEKIPQDNLAKLSNRRLWQLYDQHDKLHTIYYQWGWIPVAADMFHNNLTDALKDYLRGTGVAEDKVNEYLVTLTQPTKKSLLQIEQDEFLKIAIKIQNDHYHFKLFKELYKNFKEQEAAPYGLKTHTPEYEKMLEKRMDEIKDKIKPLILTLIQNHYRKYFYISFMWINSDAVYSFEHYLKELVKIVNSGTDLAKKYQDQEKEFKANLALRAKLIKQLKIKKPWSIIIDSWGDFMVTKIYRRFAQIFAIYQMQAILVEIAKRLNLSLMQVRFMLNSEVKAALLTGQLDRYQLKKRTRFCVYWVELGKEAVFVDDQARFLAKPVLSAKVKAVDEIKGQTGCIGRAKGKVKIVIRPKDMVKFNKGDILVSIATDPDIVPAMKKAAAIVTEQGGVTSHAAIVSRELGIPCVIGTKIATKVLKDGDEVEVDATKGIVKKI